MSGNQNYIQLKDEKREPLEVHLDLEEYNKNAIPSIYFTHSDEKRIVMVENEEWKGQNGLIVSDNIVEAIFELVEDKNLSQEKAIAILEAHGFYWERKNTHE